ncbi:MAG: capsular biosynthesis protein [Gammaproteobacteria bacterium]|nr:capsular biosynthesis protein [Gammaproteobacteria bacterium]
MFDLHSHLLPGIDDGASTMPEAVEMARLAVLNGITHSVVTPHIHPGRYENDIRTISAVFDEFVEQLNRDDVPLTLGMAAEVRISMEMVEMLEQHRIPFLGELDGYSIILLEFPHEQIIPGSVTLVDMLINRQIRPLVAHPERNKDIIRNFEAVRPLVDAGCLLQVTAGSLEGRFGEPAQQRAIELLEHDWVYILASDAHNLRNRPPELEPGRRVAAKIIGEEESWRLVKQHPARIFGV